MALQMGRQVLSTGCIDVPEPGPCSLLESQLHIHVEKQRRGGEDRNNAGKPKKSVPCIIRSFRQRLVRSRRFCQVSFINLPYEQYISGKRSRLFEHSHNTVANAPDGGDGLIMQLRNGAVNGFVVFFYRHYICAFTSLDSIEGAVGEARGKPLNNGLMVGRSR